MIRCTYQLTTILLYALGICILLTTWCSILLMKVEFENDEKDKSDEDKDLAERLMENETNPEYQTCTVPQLDPYDVSIKSLIIHPDKLICQKVQPNIFYLNSTGHIIENSTEFKLYNLTLSNDSIAKTIIRCTVNVQLVNVDDFGSYDYDRSPSYSEDEESPELRNTEDYEKQIFPFLISKGDYAVVHCFNEEYTYTTIYSELFLYPGASTHNKTFANESEDHLSVLMFFIDSISISSLKRHLPKTLQVMNKMGFYIFSSFNKVADNSFPNLMPILTGKRAYSQQPDMADEFNEDITKITFDHWPFIWKDFAKKGYVTLFSEDTPYMGLFHLGANGFKNPPTNYYYHEFWKTLSWQGKIESQSEFCTGNKPNVEVQLDLVRKHFTKYKNKRQFLWIYLTELSHSYDYNIEQADEIIAQFFLDSFKKDRFNKTAIIFQSDHGHRSSVIRTTKIGLLEERLPFFSIYIPKWFRKKHKNIDNNIKINCKERRLTSHFDTHETLRDLLNSNFNGQQRSREQRGQSQFYPIPANRSCKEAGIPLFYCTCQQLNWIPMHNQDKLIKNIAYQFIDALNSELLSAAPGKCRNFSLLQVLKVEKLRIITQGKGEWLDYRIKLIANPKRATFEGLMRRYSGYDKFGLGSDFSRLDRYGNQSHCINDKRIKKICICNGVT